jgi:hypothetical protein
MDNGLLGLWAKREIEHLGYEARERWITCSSGQAIINYFVDSKEL